MKMLNFASSFIVMSLLVSSAYAQVTDQPAPASESTATPTTAKKKKKVVNQELAQADTTNTSKPDDLTTTKPNPDKESGASLPERPEKKADIDDEITNAKLRAQTGAKRALSFQSSINYNGGSLQKPLDSERPQLSPGVVVQEPSAVSGTLAGKYRLTEHDNLNVGFGFAWVRPGYVGPAGAQYGEASDPYLGYNRLFKAFGIQNVFETIFTYYTDRTAVNSNDFGEIDVDHTILWTVPKTSWQLGLNLAYTHDFYSKNNGGGSPVDELAAYPYIEYELNTRFSFRTVYRGFTYFNTLGDSSTFHHDDATESLGIGIAVTRDIYLYPNVQWVWSDMRQDKTNVALSTNINL